MNMDHLDFDVRSFLKALSHQPRKGKGWPAPAVNLALGHGWAESVPGTDRLRITDAGRPYGRRITKKG